TSRTSLSPSLVYR
ncbi:hypothetical protein AZE42_07573, partial [Rhizopogon vesiculosus]